MNAMTTPGAKKNSLVEQACALFSTDTFVCPVDKIPAFLFALGIREACVRCGGSGHYSFTPRYGTTCFGCGGKRERGAKLTKVTLALAIAKVEAGELVAVRALAAEKLAAKKLIKPLVVECRALAHVIGVAYEVGYKASNASWDAEKGAYAIELTDSPVFRAQTLANAFLYRSSGRGVTVTDIEFSVQDGSRRDYPACVAELTELRDMLESLVGAWIAWVEAGNPTHLPYVSNGTGCRSHSDCVATPDLGQACADASVSSS